MSENTLATVWSKWSIKNVHTDECSLWHCISSSDLLTYTRKIPWFPIEPLNIAGCCAVCYTWTYISWLPNMDQFGIQKLRFRYVVRTHICHRLVTLSFLGALHFRYKWCKKWCIYACFYDFHCPSPCPAENPKTRKICFLAFATPLGIRTYLIY